MSTLVRFHHGGPWLPEFGRTTRHQGPWHDVPEWHTAGGSGHCHQKPTLQLCAHAVSISSVASDFLIYFNFGSMYNYVLSRKHVGPTTLVPQALFLLCYVLLSQLPAI